MQFLAAVGTQLPPGRFCTPVQESHWEMSSPEPGNLKKCVVSNHAERLGSLPCSTGRWPSKKELKPKTTGGPDSKVYCPVTSHPPMKVSRARGIFLNNFRSRPMGSS